MPFLLEKLGRIRLPLSLSSLPWSSARLSKCLSLLPLALVSMNNLYGSAIGTTVNHLVEQAIAMVRPGRHGHREARRLGRLEAGKPPPTSYEAEMPEGCFIPAVSCGLKVYRGRGIDQ
jgi:hypothetical protein